MKQVTFVDLLSFFMFVELVVPLAGEDIDAAAARAEADVQRVGESGEGSLAPGEASPTSAVPPCSQL